MRPRPRRIERCLQGEQGGTSLDARRMSTSTRACYDFSVPVHHKSPGNAGSQGFFGSAAIACLVVGCAWTVYANVFGASVYPALSNGNFDAPVVRRTSALAGGNLPLVAGNSVIVESAPVLSRPASVAPEPFAFICGPLCRRGAGFGGAGAGSTEARSGFAAPAIAKPVAPPRPSSRSAFRCRRRVPPRLAKALAPRCATWPGAPRPP